MEVDKIKQYKTFIEWKRDNPSMYQNAKRNGWVEEICDINGWVNLDGRVKHNWDKETCIEIVSGYKLKREWYNSRDGSYAAAKKYGWYSEICKLKGWSVSTPSIPLSYWDKEKCIEEARKYKSFKKSRDWRLGSPGSYKVAYREGWLEEISILFDWKYHTPPGYWVKEKCIEEALNYETRTHWRKLHNISFNSAKKNGWFDECISHMRPVDKKPMGYWTKEKCIKEALKYNTQSEWVKHNNNSVQAAFYNSWIEECTKHMVKLVKSKWTKELLHIEVSKFKTYTEFMKSGNLYHVARKYGWVDYVSKDLIKTKKQSNYWDIKENIIEEIKKYRNVSEWKKHNNHSIVSAKRNGWYKECKDYFETLKTIKWSKEKCLEEAKKYKLKGDWSICHNPTYLSAIRNGWYEECTKHMVILKRPAGYWTLDKCKEDAQRFNSKSEWEEEAKNSYLAALKKGWIEECVKHMVVLRRKNGFWDVKENCIIECSKYDNEVELRKALGSYPIFKIRKNGWFDECTKHIK